MTQAPTPRVADARRQLLPLLAAQFFDGAGGRFSALLLGLWAARVAGIAGFSGFASAGLMGTAVAALVIGAIVTRLPGRTIMFGAVGGLIAARIGSYASVAFGLGLVPVFACTFLAAMCGSVMVNAAKVFVPDDERASSSFAWMGLFGSLGSAIGAGLAGVVAASAPVWLLVALGPPVATLSLGPMVALARNARNVPRFGGRRARVAIQAVARSRNTIGLVVAIGTVTAGLGLLRDGIVADLYSSRWIWAVSLAALVGDLLATQVVRRVSERWGAAEHDTFLWPGLAVIGTLVWGVADEGIAWLVVGQTIAGVVGATRASLADARLLQVAGRDGIALVSSVKDAIGAGTGALMLLVTPRLLTHLGYEGTSVLLSAALLTVPVVAGLARRLPSRLPRWAWALEVRRSERRAFVVPWR